MLAISKSKDLKQLMVKIQHRLAHMKEVKSQYLQFMMEVEELFSSFAQKIYKQMATFEDKIVRNSLYSNNKTDEIINMAKIYQQYSLQLQKNAKISLINLEKINEKDILAREEELAKKSKQLLKEFEEYLKSQKEYDKYFGVYRTKCSNLDQAISKYPHNDPIFFYNQASPSRQIKQIESKFNDCSNFQTSVMNETQRLDLTRKQLSENIKQISDCYVSILHIYLNMLQMIITSIVDCKKEQSTMRKLGLRKSSINAWDKPSIQLEQLDGFFSEYNHNSPKNKPNDQIIQDFSDLFANQINVNSSNSDAKLFFDRCDNMCKKKIKTVNEVIKMQNLLINQFQSQSERCDEFQAALKTIEKDIFTKNGIDSYKKRFRKYFGSNFLEIGELCLAVIQRQKKSFQKINRSMVSNRIKFRQLINQKEEIIKIFSKRSKIILEEHLKLKQKLEKEKPTNEGDRLLKENISQCFKEIKQSFVELSNKQSQIDRQFFGSLKNHNESALKLQMNTLKKVLERQKNRVTILTNLDINSQIVLILKEDRRYDMLLHQCPKPNLYQTFQSLANKDKYDQTKNLLKKKQKRLSETMLIEKGCFGNINLSPKNNIILSSHSCYLVYNPQSKTPDVQKMKGSLKITSNSIIFQQKVFISFLDKLNLTIPANDIEFFQASNNTNFKQGVQIRTEYGELLFQSKHYNEIIQSIQKNLTFKPKDLSQSRIKKSQSTSFLKNNTSTEYRVSFEKSNLAEVLQNSPKPNKANKGKAKSQEALIKQFIGRWQDENFLSKSFINVATKSKARRDFTYESGFSKIFVKELREYDIKDKNIILMYKWKISFPDSPMLHSFKHTQSIYIESIAKQLSIKVIKQKYSEEQLYIKNKFYQEIEQMNQRLTFFISNLFQKEAKVVLESEENNKAIDNSFRITLQDVVITQRESKIQKNQSSMRNSMLQRRSSLFNGYKTL